MLETLLHCVMGEYSLKGYTEYHRSTLGTLLLHCVVGECSLKGYTEYHQSTLETLLHCLVGESSAEGYPESLHRYTLETPHPPLCCAVVQSRTSIQSPATLYCFTLRRLREAFPMPRYAMPSTICDHLPVWRKEKQQCERLLQLSGGLSWCHQKEINKGHSFLFSR